MGDTLPRPDVEFDFNLPHGIDAKDTQKDDQNMELSHPACDELEKGFSDDDDANEAFDRSWFSHQARKSSPKDRKSPRNDNEDDEMSPSNKRPRQSLFGGPTDEAEESQNGILEEPPQYPCETSTPSKYDAVQEPGPPDRDVTDAQPSLSPHPPLFDFPLNVGVGLSDSDRDSMSPRNSPIPSADTVIIPPDAQLAYGLRTCIDRKAAFTFLDQDTSGNFDPTEEEKKKTLKLKQDKAAKAVRRVKKGKQRASKEPTKKRIARLHFENFGNVRNITNDKDNWPDDWDDEDSEVERKRPEKRDSFRRRSLDYIPQTPIADPSIEVDDLTGHPAARGCTSCRVQDMDCSLISGGAYPCEQCRDQDCEIIIAPTEKGHCEQCANDGIDCSLEDDPNNSVCDSCVGREYVCKVRPPIGYRANRIRIDEIIYGEDRPFVQCTICRQKKKLCSLKKKTDKPPCKSCKKHHLGCTFYELPKVEKKSAKPKKPTEGYAPEVGQPGHDYFTAEDLKDLEMEDVQRQSRSPTPEIEMEDNDGHKGMLTKVKVSFSHPIHFSESESTTDCNFCEIPSFGFVGFFERDVHVIRWYDGLGYTEVGGGHAENNGQTTMCQDCTFDRVQILSCEDHHLQSLFPEETRPDFEDTLDSMLKAEDPADIKQQLQRWCSMCFSPAIFTCQKRQVSLLSPEDAEVGIDGCGLKLCTECEHKLRENFEGDSSFMAATLDLEGKAKEEDEDMNVTVVRADVGFLSRDGLLMRNLGNSAEEAG